MNGETTKDNNLGKKKVAHKSLVLEYFFPAIVVALMAIVLAAGYFLVLQDQYQQLIDTKQQEKNLRANIANLKERQELIKKYQTESFNFSDSEQKLLTLALPSEFDTSSFIIQMKNIADNYNFLINSIKISETAVKPAVEKKTEQSSSLKKVEIEMELGGSDYANWKKFLGALESSIMIFDVNLLDFSTESPVYKLKLVTYYYSK